MKKLFAFILIVTVLFCCSCASQKTVVYSGSLIDLPLLEQHSTDNALTTVGTPASIVGNERWIAYVDSEQRLLYTDKTGISHCAEQSFNQQGDIKLLNNTLYYTVPNQQNDEIQDFYKVDMTTGIKTLERQCWGNNLFYIDSYGALFTLDDLFNWANDEKQRYSFTGSEFLYHNDTVYQAEENAILYAKKGGDINAIPEERLTVLFSTNQKVYYIARNSRRKAEIGIVNAEQMETQLQIDLEGWNGPVLAVGSDYFITSNGEGNLFAYMRQENGEYSNFKISDSVTEGPFTVAGAVVCRCEEPLGYETPYLQPIGQGFFVLNIDRLRKAS